MHIIDDLKMLDAGYCVLMPNKCHLCHDLEGLEVEDSMSWAADRLCMGYAFLLDDMVI